MRGSAFALSLHSIASRNFSRFTGRPLCSYANWIATSEGWKGCDFLISLDAPNQFSELWMFPLNSIALAVRGHNTHRKNIKNFIIFVHKSQWDRFSGGAPSDLCKDMGNFLHSSIMHILSYMYFRYGHPRKLTP